MGGDVRMAQCLVYLYPLVGKKVTLCYHSQPNSGCSSLSARRYDKNTR
jgi:hypothetical protein